MKDMSIYEWLRRLNMQQWAPKFKKDLGINRVTDLRFIDDKQLKETAKVEALTDRKRLLDMIKGEDASKNLFKYQTRS